MTTYIFQKLPYDSDKVHMQYTCIHNSGFLLPYFTMLYDKGKAYSPDRWVLQTMGVDDCVKADASVKIMEWGGLSVNLNNRVLEC